ncbi:hypothetical protein [Eudoraea chungangensis]|uniref:hypothetical protein n=1 Tax=Eudoraea chungangensis TaxID=1481905 RepID=UPI0023ECBC76|nr:hypothetical protein [Eudoraea chungangensis]
MKATTLSLILCMSLTFAGCSSKYSLTKTAPFQIGNAKYEANGAKSAKEVPGFELSIEVMHNPSVPIHYKEVYFREQILSPKALEKDGRSILICTYIKPGNSTKPDIIMDADSTKEVGNQPPYMVKQSKTEFPFKLRNSEAIISYTQVIPGQEQDRVFYYKISDIKEK